MDRRRCRRGNIGGFLPHSRRHRKCMAVRDLVPRIVPRIPEERLMQPQRLRPDSLSARDQKPSREAPTVYFTVIDPSDSGKPISPTASTTARRSSANGSYTHRPRATSRGCGARWTASTTTSASSTSTSTPTKPRGEWTHAVRPTARSTGWCSVRRSARRSAGLGWATGRGQPSASSHTRVARPS